MPMATTGDEFVFMTNSSPVFMTNKKEQTHETKARKKWDQCGILHCANTLFYHSATHSLLFLLFFSFFLFFSVKMLRFEIRCLTVTKCVHSCWKLKQNIRHFQMYETVAHPYRGSNPELRMVSDPCRIFSLLVDISLLGASQELRSFKSCLYDC